jgi:tyrosine-protein kinase Etk/Wzc
VLAGKIFELNRLVFPSVTLKLTADFISEPHTFSFFILSKRQAIDWLIKNLSIQFPKEDRQNSVMYVSLKGRDYPLIADVANAIVENFADLNADTRRSKKSDAEQILEKQLQEAKANLAGAEEMVRRFREVNPKVGSASIMGSSFTDASGLESSVANLNRWIEEANALRARCSGSTNAEDQITAFLDAVTFLSARQSVAAPALQLEANEAAMEKRRVDADYAPQHPAVQENRQKISRLAVKVASALSDLIDKMRSDVSISGAKLRAITEESRRLPAKEVQLLSLERKRATMAEIYSDILTRFNANKMSETSKAGSVSIIDRAVAPIPPGRLETMSKLLMIGLILAFGFGFGPAMAVDYFDKRARTEEDFRRFSTLPFLEGIPIKEGSSKKHDKEKLDERLVASGFEPGIFDEMYRSLRTKILLHLHDEKNKLLVVTSLNIGDGKSLSASNLAIVMAQQKLKTLLIDGDIRKGVQHHSFVLEKKPGLSEILASPEDLTVIPIHSMIQQTHIPNLSLLACGMPVPNPAECMNSQKFRDLTSMLSEWFEVIILDTPPLQVAVDAAILPDAFKHYVVVARVAKTSITAIDKKIDEFPGLRKKILGIVLNGTAVDKKMSSYRYSYYHH